MAAWLALALVVAEVDGGNERVVDTEERELSMIDANALSCARDSHSVGREEVVAVCCVCLYLVHMQRPTSNSSFLPPPPLRALTSRPNCAFPILSTLGVLL